MIAGAKPVFVLGAGFTRAFLPGAPLLRHWYDTHSLMQAFRGFPHATRILEGTRQEPQWGNRHRTVDDAP